MADSGEDLQNVVGGDGGIDARISSLEAAVAELRTSQEATSARRSSSLFINSSDGDSCQLDNGAEVLIAGLGRRLMGALADNLPFAMLFTLAYCLMVFLQSAIAAILVFLFGAMLQVVYHMAMLTNDGQTFGRKMANVRVVMFRDGASPDATAIFKRGAVATGFHAIPWILMIPTAVLIDTGDGLEGAAVALVLLLAATATWCVAMAAYYLVNASFLWNITGQGWHDRVAGTIVVATVGAGGREERPAG